MNTQRLITEIHNNGLFQQGKFTLSSGIQSDYYLDLRPLY